MNFERGLITFEIPNDLHLLSSGFDSIIIRGRENGGQENGDIKYYGNNFLILPSCGDTEPIKDVFFNQAHIDKDTTKIELRVADKVKSEITDKIKNCELYKYVSLESRP